MLFINKGLQQLHRSNQVGTALCIAHSPGFMSVCKNTWEQIMGLEALAHPAYLEILINKKPCAYIATFF